MIIYSFMKSLKGLTFYTQRSFAISNQSVSPYKKNSILGFQLRVHLKRTAYYVIDKKIFRPYFSIVRRCDCVATAYEVTAVSRTGQLVNVKTQICLSDVPLVSRLSEPLLNWMCFLYPGARVQHFSNVNRTFDKDFLTLNHPWHVRFHIHEDDLGVIRMCNHNDRYKSAVQVSIKQRGSGTIKSRYY